jgi:hypothetical protein
MSLHYLHSSEEEEATSEIGTAAHWSMGEHSGTHGSQEATDDRWLLMSLSRQGDQADFLLRLRFFAGASPVTASDVAAVLVAAFRRICPSPADFASSDRLAA